MKKLLSISITITLLLSSTLTYFAETPDYFGKQDTELIDIMNNSGKNDTIPVSVRLTDIDYDEAYETAINQLKSEVSKEMLDIAFFGGKETSLSSSQADKEIEKIVSRQNAVVAEMTEINNETIIEELFPEEKPEIIESAKYEPTVSMNLKKYQIMDILSNPDVTKVSTLEPVSSTAPYSTSDFKKVTYLAQTPSSLKSGSTWTVKLKNGTAEKWTSSNTKVAKVSGGKITALSKGTATISVKLKTGSTLKCSVKVTTSPAINKTSVKVKKGKSVSVKITGKASAINNSYTNTKYAKITSGKSATTLKIKGLKKGTTYVKVKVNSVKTFKIKVKVTK